MPATPADALEGYFRRLRDGAAPQDDTVLLERFVTSRDRDAFELLIARHGPMVLGAARRAAGNAHDADDVFQAVFLSLARLAGTIRRGRTLPAWLHQTTLRVAARLRTNRPTPFPGPPPGRGGSADPAADLAWREVRQALDEELHRLPERLRAPLVLCYLSGLTRDEAAVRLGWSLGTLKRRLGEGRDLLRTRLERRGLAAVGLALAVASPDSLQAAFGRPLVVSVLDLLTAKAAPPKVSALVLGSAMASEGLAVKSALAVAAAAAVAMGLYAAAGRADPPGPAGGGNPDTKPAAGGVAVPHDDPLPAGSALRFGTSRFRLGVPITAMAVSADGTTAVVANGSHWLGSARVFDLASGLPRYSLDRDDRHRSHIEAVAISPDGRTIATKQDAGELRLCLRDATTGREIRSVALSPPAGARNVNEMLAFTPDGRAVAATSRGETVHLVNADSGEPVRDFVHGGTVFALTFSPDGKVLATGANEEDGRRPFTRLWAVQTGRELRRLWHGPGGYDRCLAFSPDATALACGGDDARLRVVDAGSGKERFACPKDGYRINAVAFTPTARRWRPPGTQSACTTPPRGRNGSASRSGRSGSGSPTAGGR